MMENAMLSPDRMPDLAPLAAAAADYDIVRRAIAHIRGNWRAQPEIEEIAEAAGVTPTELHHLFRRWAGLTPKAFLQALTLDSARKLLRDSASVLDATYEVGLSGPGRLHDLFVTHEAMSPGEWKSGGEGLTISYGFHPVAVRHRAGDGDRRAALRPRLRRPRRGEGGARRHAPPLAEGELRRGQRAHRAARRAHLRPEAVAAGPAAARGADRHRLRGAGVGDAAAHPDGPRHHLFRHRRQDRQRPRRRARSAPRSARTRSRFVVPCHRVLGKSGDLTGYHWGLTRKRAMLGWEAGNGRGVAARLLDAPCRTPGADCDADAPTVDRSNDPISNC